MYTLGTHAPVDALEKEHFSILQEIDTIKTEISKLEEEISILKDASLKLEDLLELWRGARSNGSISEGTDNKAPIQEMIMQIFAKQPGKRWTPTLLRDRLVSLRDEGKLQSDAQNINDMVHVILRRLTTKGHILRTGSGRESQFYKPIIGRKGS